METRDKKLRAAIMELPGNFNEYRENANRRFDKLEEAIDEARYVDLINGDGNKVKTAKIIPTMHKDIKEIKTVVADLLQNRSDTKEALEIVSDFSKLHRIFKKYKFYYVMAIMIGVFAGVNVWEFLIEIAKTALK